MSGSVTYGSYAAPANGGGRSGAQCGEPPRLLRSDGKPLRILVVEDELAVRHDIEDYLTACGADMIAGTPWGAAGVLLARQQHPDVVVLDIQLFGDVDGIEAGREILSRIGIPVVFLSVRDDEETRGRIAALGGPELVHKLEVREKLVPAIRRACGLE